MSEVGSSDERPLRLGVSSCLLGNEVRFDGGHKRDRFVADLLGGFVDWVPVCPEVEVGMGTPRPALRLAKDSHGLRMLEVESGRDHTRSMNSYSGRRVRALRGLDLCGYVLKADSPSCGLIGVKIFGEKGAAMRAGRGLFASALMRAFPNLPVEDEGRLHDPKRRDNFIERLFAYQRLSELFRGRWTARQVVEFHTAHKLQLMAHSTSAYDELGRRLATPNEVSRAVFRERYASGFMAALAHRVSLERNAAVLEHAAELVEPKLDPASRSELGKLVHDYREGVVPLVAPVTLLRQQVRLHGVDDLIGQTYLEPHPKESMLRNHVSEETSTSGWVLP